MGNFLNRWIIMVFIDDGAAIKFTINGKLKSCKSRIDLAIKLNSIISRPLDNASISPVLIFHISHILFLV